MTWGGVAETERIGSTRLERWSGVGWTTLRVRTTPHSSIGWVVVGAYTARAELRQVVSIENRDITIAALTYYHDPDEIVIALDSPTLNVRWFGAVGDGVTDDTDAIQAAIDAAYAIGGGTVLLPRSTYIINEPLILYTGVFLKGAGHQITNASLYGTEIKAGASWSGEAMVTTPTAAQYNYGLYDLRLRGTTSVNNGVLFRNDKFAYLVNVTVDTCAQAGVWLDLTSGSANSAYLYNVWVQNALLSTLAARTGAIHIDWTDCEMFACAGAMGGDLDYSQNGNRVGILITGATNFLYGCVGQMSETGIVLATATGHRNMLIGCRADLNRGDGFIVESHSNILNGCLSLSNGQETDDTYTGFLNTADYNVYTGCNVSSVYTNDVKYAYKNTATTGSRFVNCYGLPAAYKTALYDNSTHPAVSGWECNQSLVITATADDTTPSVENARFLHTAANTGATEITQLDNGVVGQIVTIRCASATNPPTITGGGNFILSANWTPGLNDTLTVYSNGTAWYEIARSDN